MKPRFTHRTREDLRLKRVDKLARDPIVSLEKVDKGFDGSLVFYAKKIIISFAYKQ